MPVSTFLRIFLFLFLSVYVNACALFVDANANADRIASCGHLQRELVKTSEFVLTVFLRISDPNKPINVYFEGDGLAWQSRSEPSPDPTPRKAMGLALAAVDKAENVIYLARPCQFTPSTMNPQCGIPFWTSKRFSAEVVESINQAVTQLVARAPGQKLNLVGYSGGGAIAVLVAARRSDVASIRTVAGNLNHQAVNKLHTVSLMPESLNPIDFAGIISNIPQIHFVGAEDDVIPPSIAEGFLAAFGQNKKTKIHVVPQMEHESDWPAIWPSLLKEQL